MIYKQSMPITVTTSLTKPIYILWFVLLLIICKLLAIWTNRKMKENFNFNFNKQKQRKKNSIDCCSFLCAISIFVELWLHFLFFFCFSKSELAHKNMKWLHFIFVYRHNESKEKRQVSIFRFLFLYILSSIWLCAGKKRCSNWIHIVLLLCLQMFHSY